MLHERKFSPDNGSEQRKLTKEQENFAIAKQELFKSFGWSIETIESPEAAPTIIDFARFWEKSGLADGYRGKEIVFPRTHEIFVGINYKPKKKEIDVSEVTVGMQYEVTPEGLHFVEIHQMTKG